MKSALIYIPGLSDTDGAYSVDVFARKLAVSFDRATPPSVSVAMIQGKDETYGAPSVGATARLRTIVLKENGRELTSIDLYELDYNQQLTARFGRRPLLVQIVILLLTLVRSLPKYLTALRRPGQALGHKLQLIWVTFLLGAIASYALVLVYGIWIGVTSLRSPTERAAPPPAATATTAPPGISDASRPASSPVRQKLDESLVKAILLLGGLGALTKTNAKEFLRCVAVEYVCVIDYFQRGRGRAALTGKLVALVDHLAAKQPAYDGIDVLGYSFGSALAIDGLLDESPSPITYDQVRTLVTLGCPFDLVRTYWPKYFDGRHTRAPRLARWVNVYSPSDVLASNFRNDSKRAEATAGVALAGGGRVVPGRLPAGSSAGPEPGNVVWGNETDTLGIVQAILLEGFLVHGAYWDSEDDNAASSLDNVVTHLWAYPASRPSPANATGDGTK